LQEMLGRKEAEQNAFYTVEDKAGEIRGFSSLRGANGTNREACFGEMVLIFLDEDTYDGPIADETLAHLQLQAFGRLRLNKIVAHCLDSEQGLRAFLLTQGFESSGKLRDVFYGQGRYQAIEAFSFHKPNGEDRGNAPA